MSESQKGPGIKGIRERKWTPVLPQRCKTQEEEAYFRMALDMLRGALIDYAGLANYVTPVDMHRAEEWIEGEVPASSFIVPLEKCCAMLGIHPEEVRRVAYHLRENGDDIGITYGSGGLL